MVFKIQTYQATLTLGQLLFTWILYSFEKKGRKKAKTPVFGVSGKKNHDYAI